MKKNNLLSIIFIIAISFLFACNSSDKSNNTEETSSDILKFSDIKVGDKLDGITVSETLGDEYSHIINFSGEYVVEGKISFSPAPSIFYIGKTLISQKIDFDGNVIDLAKEGLCVFNSEEIKKYIPADYLGKSTDGWMLKDEYDQKLNIKVIMTDIIFETATPFRLGGTVTKVISFNGNDNPKPADEQTVAEENKIIKIGDIKNGDKIEGLTVTKIEYVTNDHYQINLNGKFIASGKITYSEFEDSWQMILDEETIFKTIINIDGEQYEMCKYISFRNLDKVKAALGSDKIKMITKEQEVSASFNVNNLIVGCNFDKGVLAFGSVDFIKKN